jgi:hypothetical protein
LFHKTFNIDTKNLIRQIPNATSKEQVCDLLQQIENTKGEGIKGTFIYFKNFKKININILKKNYYFSYRMVKLLLTTICFILLK